MIRFFARAYEWLLYRCGSTGDFSRLTFDEADVRLFAVGLQRTSSCTAHAVIAYRNSDDEVRLLHFANHQSLRDEPARGQYIFAIPLLKDEDLEFLAGLCGRVYRANRMARLPYSFEFDPNIMFNRDTGLTVLNEDSGLTCSTFVVAFFRSGGSPLVRPITWPQNATEADIRARKYLLEIWRESGRPHLLQRADEIEATIQTMRISPEQVTGACLQKNPIGYFRASYNGTGVLTAFTERFGAP